MSNGNGNTLDWYVYKHKKVVEKMEGHTLTLTTWGKIVIGVRALKKAGFGATLIVKPKGSLAPECFPFDTELTETKVWDAIRNRDADHQVV